MFVSLKAVVFYGGGACGVSLEFIVSSLAGAGERGSPGKRESGNESFRASGTKNLSFPTRASDLQLNFHGTIPARIPP